MVSKTLFLTPDVLFYVGLLAFGGGIFAVVIGIVGTGRKVTPAEVVINICSVPIVLLAVWLHWTGFDQDQSTKLVPALILAFTGLLITVETGKQTLSKFREWGGIAPPDEDRKLK